MVLEGYLDKNPKEKDKETEGEAESLRLTSRQREMVKLLAEGKSSKEVAAVLGLSVKTAETPRATSCAGSIATRLRSWCATRSEITSSPPEGRG